MRSTTTDYHPKTRILRYLSTLCSLVELKLHCVAQESSEHPKLIAEVDGFATNELFGLATPVIWHHTFIAAEVLFLEKELQASFIHHGKKRSDFSYLVNDVQLV